MFLRNIFRNRFVGGFSYVLYHKYNLNSIRKYTQHALKRAPLPVSGYLCFALLNVMCASDIQSKTDENEDEKTVTVESAISKSDEFFLVGKFHDSWKMLEPFKDTENVEILWRISRALYNLSKQKGISSKENALMIRKAHEYIEKALSLDKNHYAVHKWMAILYDAKSALDGMKARINALPVFKEHLMVAIQLNPKDATSIYMLGQYMYNIADMSWLQKTIAKTLFGTPPEATFEEAFQYFSRAEEVEPNFYSANLLMLGKTCLKLKKIEAARYWLKCAIAYPVRTDEDESVRLEAEELLKKNPGVKHSENKEGTQNIQ